MKKLVILTFFFFVVKASFSQLQVKTYEIVGSAAGFADSTKLYLDTTSFDGKPRRFDSTYIVREQFFFSGALKSRVLRVVVRTDYKNYKFFWLENAKMTFKAEKGKFTDAVITGSKTQEDADQLEVTIKATKNGKEQNIGFIRSHPASILSAYLLSISGTAWHRDTIATLYNGLTESTKNTSYGKNVYAFLSLNKNVKVGDRYVDFSQNDTQQKSVRLSDFDGKVVLLEFWGSWCTPCRKGNPELVKIYQEFKDRGFEILGVGVETSKEAWLKAIKIDNLPWTNVTDLKGDKNEAVVIYGVSSYPANFLIDKKGTIIAKDLHSESLREKLKELL